MLRSRRSFETAASLMTTSGRRREDELAARELLTRNVQNRDRLTGQRHAVLRASLHA